MSTDHWKTIQVTTSSVTITLSDAATMAAGYKVSVANQSTGNISVVLASATDTIDTVTNTTDVLSAKEIRSYLVNAAATGYITHSGSQVPFIDSNPVVIGSADKTKKVRFEVDGLTTGTTRTITVPDADVTLLAAATQAEQETATSTAVVVTPGRQHFHPSASKAWGKITPATTVSASYPAAGVSVVKNGTGDFTVTHGVTFSSSNYAILIGIQSTSALQLTHRISTQNTTTFRITFELATDGTDTDPESFYYDCKGDL